MVDEAKPREKTLLVFVQELDQDDKTPSLLFYHVTRDELDGRVAFAEAHERRAIFAKKKMTVARPGSVYEFECSRDDGFSIFPGTKRFVATWPDDDMRVKWEAMHRAFCVARDARKLEKKEGGKSAFSDRLAPLRERYHKLPYPHRQAFLAAVMYEITK
jgi:hypothetical protein